MKQPVSCQRIRKGVWGLLILWLFHTTAFAQEKEDTATLAYAFHKGSVQGNLRNALLLTNNAPGLTDYQADAVGGHLVYQTGGFKGFRLAVGTHFTFPLTASGLSKPDEATGALNRYEATLFDVTQPLEKRNLAIISLLNLTWQWKGGRIILGRQWLNTPFINMQDNRMQPTAVEGLNSADPFAKMESGSWLVTRHSAKRHHALV